MRRLMQGENLPAGARESRRLRGVLEDLAQVTGSAQAAGAELQFLLEQKASREAMGRFVDLAQSADGLQLPSVREAFTLLESSPDQDLNPAFHKLLEACGRDAKAALQEYRWMEGQLQPADSRSKATKRLAGLWARAGEAGADDVHRSFLNQGPAAAAPATPPHLAAALDTIARLTGSPDAAREELKFALDHAAPGPDQQATLDRYLALLRAADGVELPAVRQAWERLEKANDKDLREAFLKLLKADGRSATRAVADLDFLEKRPLQGPALTAAVEQLARVASRSGDLAPDSVRQAWINQQAGPAAQTPPHLARALDTIARLTGSPDAARDELKFALDHAAAGSDQQAVLDRYLALLKAADGVELPAVRQAWERLEKANDKDLREAFLKLLKADGRSATRAVADLDFLEKRPLQGPALTTAVEQLARVASQSGDLAPDSVRQAWINQQAGPAAQTPPHLARALDTIARLTGSPDAARDELKFALDHAAAGSDQQAVLDRYVGLLKAADGVELPAVRQAWERLEKANDRDLDQAFLKLLKACGRSATRALAELDWLEGQKPSGPERVQAVKDFAKHLSQSEGLAPDAVRQAFLNLGAPGQPAPPAHLSQALESLSDLLGDRQQAATELEALLKRPGASPDSLQRFVGLLRAADGLDLPSVRTVFERLEAVPQAREPFLNLLEATGRQAAPALARLQDLEKKALAPDDLAAALGVHARAIALAGETTPPLFEAVEALRLQPGAADALERLRDLLRLGVPAAEAVADLAALCRSLPPGEKQDPAFDLLLDLRRESLPDSHQAVREALSFLLALPRQDRREKEQVLRGLVRAEGNPAEAVQDLQWLVAGHPGDLKKAAKSYGKMVAGADAGGRAQVREALEELSRMPAPAAPRRRLADWLTGGPLTREEAFRDLFEMEGRRAGQALQDLKALEKALRPDETLEDGLAEMRRLFRMKEATRPEGVREAFLMLRKTLPGERAVLREELEAWAREMGDLDLGRRTVEVFRQAVDPVDRKQRGDILDRWRREDLRKGEAVDLFEAADAVRAPGQRLEDAAALADALRQDKEVATVAALLRAAGQDSRLPGSPFRTREETLGHYVGLYRVARSVREVQRMQAFLREEGHAGAHHERGMILGGCVRGLGDVDEGIAEYGFLEQALPPEEMLATGRAYAGLLQTLGTSWRSWMENTGRQAPSPRQAARDILEWARAERTAGHLGQSTMEEVLTMLASQLLVSDGIAGAQESVLDKFRPARQVGVEEEFVTIGGVQVPRRRKEEG